MNPVSFFGPVSSEPPGSATPSGLTDLPHSRTHILHPNTDPHTLVQYYRQKYRSATVCYCSKLTSILDHIHDIRVTDHQIKSVQGPLIGLTRESSPPTILIINFSKLSPDERASINELLESPPRFNGRKISQSVTIIALVNQSSNLPPDLVSRLPRQKSITPGSQLATPVPFDWNQIKPLQTEPIDPSSIVCDFHNTDINWKVQLLGGPTIDESGQWTYHEGPLITAIRNNQPILLKNPPASTDEFQDFINRLCHDRTIHANGEKLTIPPQFKIHLGKGYPVSEIDKRIHQLKLVPTPPSPPTITYHINQDTLDTCFDRYAIHPETGSLQPKSSILNLKNIILRITSPLTASQWNRLLADLAEKSANNITVYIDYTNSLPPEYARIKDRFTPTSTDSNLGTHSLETHHWDPPQVSVIYTEDIHSTTQKIQSKLGADSKPVIIDLSSNAEPGLATDAWKITSLKDRKFKVIESKLVAGIRNHQPIILRGIDTSPEVLSKIETIFSVTPYVMVNQDYVTLNSARIFVLSDPNTKTPYLNLSTTHLTDTVSESDIIRNFTNFFPTCKIDPQHQEMLIQFFSDIKDKTKKPNPVANDYPADLNVTLPLIRAIWVQANAEAQKNRPHSSPTTANWFAAICTQIRPYYQNNPKIGDAIEAIAASIFNQSPPSSPHPPFKKDSDLLQKIQAYPLTFLIGPPGTGKTHTAHQIFHDLNPKTGNPGSLTTLSIGPGTTTEDLMGSDQITGDTTAFFEGPLTKWASHHGPGYHLLVIDEANLAKPGLLNPLNGLLDDPPHMNGIQLTQFHRVIFTGNPSHMTGRSQDPIFSRAQRIYIPSGNEMSDIINHQIEKKLANPTDGEIVQIELQEQLTAEILATLDTFKSILPSREFTARDPLDIIERIDFTSITMKNSSIRIAEAAVKSLGPELSEEQYNKVIRRYQNAGIKIPEYHHPTLENIIVTPTTKRLLDTIWKNLSVVDTLINSTAQTAAAFKGRLGMRIEGPAGRGKDAVIRAVLEYRKSQHPGNPKYSYHHFNCNTNNYAELAAKITEARTNGQVIVISEPNIIKANILEGLLNTALCGNATPGFYMIFTQNPSDYPGRNEITSSLLSRFNRIPVPNYPSDEILTIMSNHIHQASDLAPADRDTIFTLFQQWQHYLDKCSPVPTPNLRPMETAWYRLKRKLVKSRPDKQPIEFYFKKVIEQQYSVYASGRPDFFCWDKILVPDQSPRVISPHPMIEPPPITNSTRDPLTPAVSPQFNPSPNPTEKPTDPPSIRSAINQLVHAVYDCFPKSPTTTVTLDADTLDRAGTFYVTRYFIDKNGHAPPPNNIRIASPIISNGHTHRSVVPSPNIVNTQTQPNKLRTMDELDSQFSTSTETMYKGYIKKTLPKNKWVPIPSLAPDQTITHYFTKPAIDIDIAQDTHSGLFYIRSQSPIRNLQLSFLVTTPPNSNYTKSLEKCADSHNLGPPINTLEIDPKSIGTILAHFNFTPTDTYITKCIKLRDYFTAFSCKPLATSKHSDFITLLNQILDERKGVCRHRARAFKIVADLVGIESQVIENECHSFIEIRIPGSPPTWTQVDLGGGRNAKIDESIPNALQFKGHQPEDNRSINRIRLENDQTYHTILLNEGIRNRVTTAIRIITDLQEKYPDLKDRILNTEYNGTPIRHLIQTNDQVSITYSMHPGGAIDPGQVAQNRPDIFKTTTLGSRQKTIILEFNNSKPSYKAISLLWHACDGNLKLLSPFGLIHSKSIDELIRACFQQQCHAKLPDEEFYTGSDSVYVMSGTALASWASRIKDDPNFALNQYSDPSLSFNTGTYQYITESTSETYIELLLRAQSHR